MIVLTKQVDSATGGDALLNLQLTQVETGSTYLQELVASDSVCKDDEIVDQAAQLCELSRDLLYRLNRVTVAHVKGIVRAFEGAVDTLRRVEVGMYDQEKAKLINSYAWHIQKRINLLQREIAPFTHAAPAVGVSRAE